MNALMKLQMYSDSETETETEEEKSPEERLPLPCFLETTTKKLPAPEINKDGKVRNFPHEPGNWATYIYIPMESSDFSDYLDSLVEFFKPLDLKPVDDFHISLTKTVVLRHHWIPDFMESVRNNLREISSFKIQLFGLKAYKNEQNTRSFLSLRVNQGNEHLSMIVDLLKDSFSEYNLDGFYQDPSFHISLLWCPGDQFSEISKYIDLLPLTLKNFDFDAKVSHCVCATGNKRFTFNFY